MQAPRSKEGWFCPNGEMHKWAPDGEGKLQCMLCRATASLIKETDKNMSWWRVIVNG